jgi:hypothetical protein
MKKIEIDINSPVFEEYCNSLNKNIISCMRELYAGNFSGGEISTKIGIELENGYEFYTSKDAESGEITEKAYEFLKPTFEHKITLTLKKRHETKGGFNERMELKSDGDKFILAEVTKAQLSLFDKEYSGGDLK